MAQGLIGLLRAELARTRARRAVILLGAGAASVLLFISWNAHHLVSESRHRTQDARSQFEQVLGEGVSAEQRAELERGLRDSAEFERSFQQAIERQVSPRTSHRITFGFFGSLPGVALAALLAATLFGAEFRWGYWKTLCSHEPRRGRIVMGKLINLWLILLLGLLGILLLSYPVNALFARLFQVGVISGLPSPGSIAKLIGRAWLVTGLYGALAAAVVLWSRSSLAGLVGSLGFLVADGILSQRLPALRYFSPTQLIAVLQDPSEGLGVTFNAWFAPVAQRDVEGGVGFVTTRVTPLPLATDTLAMILLLAWLLVILLAGLLAIRARDIPA